MLSTLLMAHSLAQPVPVEVVETEDGWRLVRDGTPYLVKGAGGDGPLDQLATAGGNSVRTWDFEGIDERLDEAHALGLTVTVGIWLGHERHGFDYSDPEQVEAQLERARQAVLRYKDHPAVLMWGIGNEMEGFDSGDDPRIWKAVNDIAVMVKELDPNHPTMTTTAEIGGGRIASMNEFVPAIDIHGINAYGGAASIPERYQAAGGTRPYVLTEFGPIGSWETPPTSWGAPPEMTSRDKAAFYQKTYESAVLGAPGLALGSYAFTWGHKMEATETWFGMFHPDGGTLPVIDTMTELWSGSPPSDRCPDIEPLVLDGPNEVDPGAAFDVRLVASDPEGGELTAQWALRHESGEYATGGDARPRLPPIDGTIKKGTLSGARVKMPKTPGPYRLFVTVRDAQGHAATANVPLLVKGDRPATGPSQWPVWVYHEGFGGMPWVPSGFMGEVDELSLTSAPGDCKIGGECIQVTFGASAGWGGIAWQHPANNWGDQDGGYDLRGAKALEFWARGARGGEMIDVGVGLLEDDKEHPDSARVKRTDLVLRPTWKRYRIPLRGADLSSLKTGFFIAIPGTGRTIDIELDGIRFVN